MLKTGRGASLCVNSTLVQPVCTLKVWFPAATRSCSGEGGGGQMCVTLRRSRPPALSILPKLAATVHLETQLWSRPPNGPPLPAFHYGWVSRHRRHEWPSSFITHKIYISHTSVTPSYGGGGNGGLRPGWNETPETGGRFREWLRAGVLAWNCWLVFVSPVEKAKHLLRNFCCLF